MAGLNLGWCNDRRREHVLGDFKLDTKRHYHVCAFCGEKMRHHG